MEGGWFIPGDFPEIDNKKWLKRIIVQDKEDERVISTENIPIERYQIKLNPTELVLFMVCE
jgi:hypothetical protein